MVGFKAFIEEFVSLFLESPYRKKVRFGLSEEEATVAREFPIIERPLAPAEMLADKIDEEGCASWHPVASPIDDELLDGFERFLGKPLPGILRAYLSYQSLLGVNLYLGALPTIDPRYPLAWLEWGVLRRRTPLYKARPGLIPFTEGPVQAAALCLDTHRPNEQGDYPVIRIPGRYESEVSLSASFEADHQVFPSCLAYFEFLRDWLRYQASGLRWEDMSFPTWLEEHGSSMPPGIYNDEE